MVYTQTTCVSPIRLRGKRGPIRDDGAGVSADQSIDVLAVVATRHEAVAILQVDVVTGLATWFKLPNMIHIDDGRSANSDKSRFG